MTPILFSFGPLKIYTLSLFLVLAFLWGGFVINKKAREYHIGDIEIYDGLVIAMVVTAICAKILDLFNLSELGIIGLWLGVFLASLMLSKKENIKLFTVMDIYSLGATLALSWWSMGLFWSGSLGGRMINLTVVGAGAERIIPVELLISLLFAIAFVWLWKVEKVYRTFTWYRGRKSSANTGFVFGTALAIFGVVSLFGFLMTRQVSIIFWLQAIIALVFGIVIVYLRSGRVLRGDLKSIGEFVREKSRHKKRISVD